jgi:hypothetical protein
MLVEPGFFRTELLTPQSTSYARSTMRVDLHEARAAPHRATRRRRHRQLLLQRWALVDGQYPTLRAAIAGMTGTVLEPTIDYLLDGGAYALVRWGSPPKL